MEESNFENASGAPLDGLNPTRGVAGFAQYVPLAVGLPVRNTPDTGGLTAAGGAPQKNAEAFANEPQTPNDAQEPANPVLIIAQRNRLAVDREVERNHVLGISEWNKY